MPPAAAISPGPPGNCSSVSLRSANPSESWNSPCIPSCSRRGPRGVLLTEDGELLYRHVSEAFASLETAEQSLERKHALGISHLRIGASTTLCKYVLLPYLQRFIQLHPHVKITITCQSTYRTLALLQEEKIDVGLVGRPASLKGCEFRPLQSIQDTFVATAALSFQPLPRKRAVLSSTQPPL